jgi:murein L,D-transpeptidase YafK
MRPSRGRRRLQQGTLLTRACILVATSAAVIGTASMQQAAAKGEDRASVAAARVRPALERDLKASGLRYGAPVFMRIFKQENLLELWLEGDDKSHVLFRSYPICTWSGKLGPKQRQGDNQAPEGFYRVSAGQMNPASRFHLSFNLGYPNAYDRAHRRTGDFLMVHGNCVSIGCYAMGDAAIEEIYTLAAAAFAGGQSAFEVHAFPFRLDDASLQARRDSPWHAFWTELKPAYDRFERDRKPPAIRVQDGHYRVGS